VKYAGKSVLDVTNDGEFFSSGTLVERIVHFWKEHGCYPSAIVMSEYHYRKLCSPSAEPRDFMGIPIEVH
jgi:hypothetical protein